MYMSISADWIYYIEGSYAYTYRAGLRPAFHWVEVESCFVRLALGGVPTVYECILPWRSLTYPISASASQQSSHGILVTT